MRRHPAILTGRTLSRNGVWSHLSGNHEAPLRAREITYPKLLKGIQPPSPLSDPFNDALKHSTQKEIPSSSSQLLGRGVARKHFTLALRTWRKARWGA